MKKEIGPSFQFYASDYLSSSKVQRMTLEEEGAYIRLLCYNWKDGWIPADIRKLAGMCKVSPKRMSRIWETLTDCFGPLPDDPDKLVNPRLEHTRQTLVQFRLEKAEAGKVGGARSGESRREANAKQKEAVLRSASVLLEANAKQKEPLLSSSSSSKGKGKGNTPIAPLKTFGEFSRVLLTSEEHAKLTAKLNGNLDNFISQLDRYSQTNPKKFHAYKSHYAVILDWFDRAVRDGKVKMSSERPRLTF